MTKKEKNKLLNKALLCKKLRGLKHIPCCIFCISEHKQSWDFDDPDNSCALRQLNKGFVFYYTETADGTVGYLGLRRRYATDAELYICDKFFDMR